MQNQKFVLVEELFFLIAQGEVQNAVTDINLGFENLKMNQTENAFTAFVIDVRDCLNKKDKRVCELVQNVVEKLKQNNNLSIFTSNRFTKAFVRELVYHVTAGCPNGCGKHSEIHSLAVKSDIYEFYPRLTAKHIPIHA